MTRKELHAQLVRERNGRAHQPSYSSIVRYVRSRPIAQQTVSRPTKPDHWQTAFRGVDKTGQSRFSGLGKVLQRFGLLSCVAFLRHARGCSLKEAIRQVAATNFLGSSGKGPSARSIEDWWYGFTTQGVSTIAPKSRSDAGVSRNLTVGDKCFLKQLVNERPELTLKEAINRLLGARDRRDSRPPSYSTVARFLSHEGLNFKKRKALRQSFVKQTKRDDESWMLSVLEGRFSVKQLTAELDGRISAEEVAELHHRLVTAALPERDRALAVLSASKGIRKTVIDRFLSAGVNFTDSLTRRYRRRGMVGSVTRKPRMAPRKYSQKEYQDALFVILHSPPAAFGINRTSWKLADLHRVMAQQGHALCSSSISKIIHDAGYTVRKAKKVLTSNDPEYQVKLTEITSILRSLKPDEKFFSVDEYGPFAVRVMGGRSLVAPDQFKSVPQRQKSKGSLILTAALELSQNQVTHFYSEHKNTDEMIKLLEILLAKHSDQRCIYFSWDAASWHASKKLYKRVEEINSSEYRATHKGPLVKLAPLPACAQFLNVIESVFSGMARAIIHNSDYPTVADCKAAIDRYFLERNEHFKVHPKRAGDKIWGKELVPATFNESNNCKDPRYRSGAH
jgi:transposase